jgi:hypothetical protein
MHPPGTLTRELARWNDGRGISISDWICCVGRYDHFVAFARLLWPEFVEYDGRLYISDFFLEERLRRSLAAGATNSAAQAMINALDITTLFSSAGVEPEQDELLYLADMLRQTWTAKLQRDFPDRDASVTVLNSLNEPGVGDLLVTISEA